MNKKGFTLIELLAVIVILGIVIAIAIPGINLVITTSRKSTFISDGQMFTTSARYKLNAEEIQKPSDNTKTIVIALNMLDLSKGGDKSSFGANWDFSKSYVVIHNEGTYQETNYVYYVALEDERNQGIELTKVDDLKKELIKENPIILPLGTAPLLGNIEGRVNNGTLPEIPSVNELTVYTKEEIVSVTPN